MHTIKTIEGELVPGGANFAIAMSKFNSFIVDRLLDGAVDTLTKHGVQDKDISVFKVPGAFELPLLVQKLIDTGRFDAVITLGAVIRGGTPHFEYVSGACTDGVNRVGLDSGIPVAFGVLTVDTIEQAVERSEADDRNKGTEAALTAIEMVNILGKLEV
ncbi:MAG: 6,7-dimethyl-8-ribityllumazine synthase [Pseudohongiellaceae bacterium]